MFSNVRPKLSFQHIFGLIGMMALKYVHELVPFD